MWGRGGAYLTRLLLYWQQHQLLVLTTTPRCIQKRGSHHQPGSIRWYRGSWFCGSRIILWFGFRQRLLTQGKVNTEKILFSNRIHSAVFLSKSYRNLFNPFIELKTTMICMESNVVVASGKNYNRRLRIWFRVSSVGPNVGNGTFGNLMC